jgi:hypothetical protein
MTNVYKDFLENMKVRDGNVSQRNRMGGCGFNSLKS